MQSNNANILNSFFIAILIFLTISAKGLAERIYINGQFDSIDKTTGLPLKWHTWADSAAQDNVTFELVTTEEAPDNNAFYINNRSNSGSACLCLSKPIQRMGKRDTYTLTGYIKSARTSGAIYINIYFN